MPTLLQILAITTLCIHQTHAYDECLKPVIALIQTNEGYSPTPYHCTQGHLTIGYGFNLTSHPQAKHLTTKAQHTNLLAKILTQEVLPDLIQIHPTIRTWPRPAQLAVIDMRYQLGPTGYR